MVLYPLAILGSLVAAAQVTPPSLEAMIFDSRSARIASLFFTAPLTVLVVFIATAGSFAQTTTPLQFVPVTPCRVVDTRNATGPFGGPALSARTSREFNIPQGACKIPSSAVAYSLNVTVVPQVTLGYLTIWPSGQPQPLVSTLNSVDGRVKANAAITPAGSNGGVSVYVTNETQVILDIDGYFVPKGTASALAFYPVTPCRVVDTRNAVGPLGGPFMAAGSSRAFPVQSSSCGLPADAKVYSLNVTVVPRGFLGYLTMWPGGGTQPLVSTLNATTGTYTANAAIVPAASNGDVSVYVSNSTDVVMDVDGYFAAPATGGLSLYTTTPCRVLDTRQSSGAFNGVFEVAVATSSCAPPSGAQAYVLNATVVPPRALGFLSLWPNGDSQPTVSTLNAIDGAVTSNMAIVPTNNGNIDAFSSNSTQLILDLSSYFADGLRYPVADAGGPYTGTAGTAIKFNGSGSNDPQGQPLTYVWNFGDSSTGTGVSPTHTYTAAGTYTISLTVTDTSHLSSTAASQASVGTAHVVAVPNVVGQTQAAASTAITSAGLVLGTVTTQSSSTVPSGSVISESPIAGTPVNAGSAINLVVSSGPPPLSAANVNLIFVVSGDLTYQAAGDVNPQTANLTDQGLYRSLLMAPYLQQNVLGTHNVTGIYALEPMTHLQTASNYPDMAALETIQQFALLNHITISSEPNGETPLPGNSFPLNASYAPAPVPLPSGVAKPLTTCPACQGLDFNNQDSDNETLVDGIVTAKAPGFYVFSAPWETVSALLANINERNSYDLALPASYAGPNYIYAISIAPSGSASLVTYNSNLNPPSSYPALSSPPATGNACTATPFQHRGHWRRGWRSHSQFRQHQRNHLHHPSRGGTSGVKLG